MMNDPIADGVKAVGGDSDKPVDQQGSAVGDPQFVALRVHRECRMLRFVGVEICIASLDPVLVHILMDCRVVTV
jgi:hypothetical protein